MKEMTKKDRKKRRKNRLEKGGKKKRECKEGMNGGSKM